MQLVLEECSEGFFPVENFRIAGIGLHLTEQFFFVMRTKLVVEVHGYLLDDFLKVVISHDDRFIWLESVFAEYL